MWRFMEGVQNPNKKIKVDVDKHQRDSEYDRSIVTLNSIHLFTGYEDNKIAIVQIASK